MTKSATPFFPETAGAPDLMRCADDHSSRTGYASMTTGTIIGRRLVLAFT